MVSFVYYKRFVEDVSIITFFVKKGLLKVFQSQFVFIIKNSRSVKKLRTNATPFYA